MVSTSTTATTLASNRRKFRLAQHQHSRPGSGSGAATAQAPPPQPQGGSTAASTVVVIVGQSQSESPPTSAAATSSSSSTSVTASTRLAAPPSYSQSQAPVAPPPTSKGRGAVSTPTGISSNNSNNTATTRGRSRRSRAATRRGVGGSSGSGGVREEAGSSSNNSSNHVNSESEQATVEEHQEDIIFSSLSDVDVHVDSARSNNAAAGVGGGGGEGVGRVHPYPYRQGTIHRTAQQTALRQHHHVNGENDHNNNNNNNNNGTTTSLNLHVVESVDSDDSGTCFNSIGTTTPRQPSPRYVGGATTTTTTTSGGGAIPHSNNHHHHDNFLPEQRQPEPEQPDFNSSSSTGDRQQQQRLLPSSKTKNRWRNRSTSNSDSMHNNMMTSSDTLSPLHEHGGSSSAIAADSSTSPSSSLPSSSYGKHGGGGNALHEQQQQQQQPHQQQDEFGSNQQSLSNRNSNNNNRSSIWDRPEEMVVSSHTNKNSQRSSNLGEDAYEHTSRSSQYNKPSDNGSTAYSEFDWDGGSSYHHVGGGGGGGGWDNYHAQHAAATTTRQGPPSTQGSVSVEYSRYDADHDIPTFHKRSSARQHGGGGGTTVSNNNNAGGIGNVGDDNDDNNDDSNTDDAVFNGTNMKATFGVCAAATLGGAILGPIGILVGAASVGIGMGVMQIPEEQRNNVLDKMRNIAFDVSDTMSSNCAKYSGTEPSEIVGMVVPNDILDQCGCLPANADSEDRGEKANNHHHGSRAGGMAGSVVDDGHSLTGTDMNFEVRSEGSSPIANAVNGVERGMNRLVGEVFGDEQNHHHHVSPTPQQPMNLVGGVGGGMGVAGDIKGRGVGVGVGGGDGVGASDEDLAGQRVACGRKGRVVPLSQIHSLRPSLQPRAWLDVMASAHTTRDDKNEAMQEILILAKDKEISRWFLEEGILDSLMFILSSYFRNYSSFLRHETPMKTSDTDKEEPFSSFKQGGNAFYHAKLAANCCVALGKAHCAAVHTEGDLLLMSAYSRGSVPVERQLAQMLFEVPHHMKVLNPSAGSDTGESQQKFDSEFTLTELSMQQAEDLASSIKALDDGKIDV